MGKLLIVVDMQNDFIDGSLGTKEAVEIVKNVASKVQSYKQRGDSVIFTRDTHDEDYLSTLEGRTLPIEHCIKGTEGWEISNKLDTYGCEIIDKPTFGCVLLGEYIKKNMPDEVEIVGLCTDICVISNAMLIKAFSSETKITVDATCCAGVTKESHLNALQAMKMCHISVINI